MTFQLSTLLDEHRRFPPSASFSAQANAGPELYAQANRDREAFWAEQAGTLDWIAPWTRVLDWQPPHAQWFEIGRAHV